MEGDSQNPGWKPSAAFGTGSCYLPAVSRVRAALIGDLLSGVLLTASWHPWLPPASCASRALYTSLEQAQAPASSAALLNSPLWFSNRMWMSSNGWFQGKSHPFAHSHRFCSQLLAATAALRPEALVRAAFSWYTWQTVKKLIMVMATAMTAQIFSRSFLVCWNKFWWLKVSWSEWLAWKKLFSSQSHGDFWHCLYRAVSAFASSHTSFCFFLACK